LHSLMWQNENKNTFMKCAGFHNQSPTLITISREFDTGESSPEKLAVTEGFNKRSSQDSFHLNSEISSPNVTPGFKAFSIQQTMLTLQSFQFSFSSLLILDASFISYFFTPLRCCNKSYQKYTILVLQFFYCLGKNTFLTFVEQFDHARVINRPDKKKAVVVIASFVMIHKKCSS